MTTHSVTPSQSRFTLLRDASRQRAPSRSRFTLLRDASRQLAPSQSRFTLLHDVGGDRNVRGSFHKYVTKWHHSVNFEIWKLGNILFVGNLIRDTHWNFYDDDIIIVTSVVLRTQSVSAVFCQQLSFTTRRVLNSIVRYETREHVQ